MVEGAAGIGVGDAEKGLELRDIGLGQAHGIRIRARAAEE
jgi:hypothetical protein